VIPKRTQARRGPTITVAGRLDGVWEPAADSAATRERARRMSPESLWIYGVAS